MAQAEGYWQQIRIYKMTNRFLKWGAFSLSALALSVAVSLPQVRANGTAPVVLVGTWKAEEIAGEPVNAKVQSTLGIKHDGQVSGSGGCNNILGQMEGDRDTVSFGPLATTKKLCPDDVMKQEYAFLSALNEARSYTANKTTLELVDGSGNLLAKLVRQ
ncbi:conserved hypothetical protein [Roseibium sp. TrichSKD4]|nr:conserved hypothetical protein [Roseibium sp. TrichSKD4]